MRRELLRYIGLACVIMLFAGILWGENKDITSLQEEIKRLEKKQEQLELEKEELVSESNRLADRIEKLKKEAKKGIGIIDEYKLKKDLRKSQGLAQRIEVLEVKIEASKIAMAGKKRELKRLYEAEISLLLEKLYESSKEGTKPLLERLRELRAAKESLEVTEERVKEEDLRVEEINIEEHDDPEKIQEKADLITDLVDKLQDRLCLIDRRIKELEKERRSEEKVREFVQELSFFDEDMLTTRGLQVQAEEKQPPTETLGAKDREPFKTEAQKEVFPERAPDRSVSGWEISPEEIGREIEELKKERGKLAQRSSDLSRKAEEFYRKAAELSKSKGATGEP